jgi:acetyl-CoA synthetase
VVKRTGGDVAMQDGRDIWYHEAGQNAPDCRAGRDERRGSAVHPLHLRLHRPAQGRAAHHRRLSGLRRDDAQYTFDYHDGDIYWCTADVGWVTGHSYIVYGPLANGATTLMFEGVPTYPSTSRFWDVVDKHKVNIFYTAPTAIRSLMGAGEEPVKKTSAQPAHPRLGRRADQSRSLEVVLQCGRRQALPHRRYLVADRDRRHLITPLPGATALKPGSATRPFFGVSRRWSMPKGRDLEGATEGNLVITDSWPGQMRTVYGDHERFVQTYFSTYKGMYFTGDGCRRDEDGYYWITGRVDDVINVSGHRMGTAEVESALVAHPKVAEAAVVGYPHDLKGQGIYAYVTLMEGEEPTDDLRKELVKWVRQEIGPIASPDLIQWAPGLPKTRSGKIMRRILRKIAEDSFDNLGDTSTLADPGVVDRSDRQPAEELGPAAVGPKVQSRICLERRAMCPPFLCRMPTRKKGNSLCGKLH